jgi:hypothetical protein
MTLKSAVEDLSHTTLEAISGCLRKLEYLAGLQEDKGEYSHWGFRKVHGDAPAKKALLGAHRSAISDVLSTPLKLLMEDVERSSMMAGVATETYLESLAERDDRLLPKNPGAGSARHLSSVLHALLGLERARERNATRRAS